MSKKLLIVLFLLAVIVIAAILYFIFFRTSPAPIINTEITNTPINKLPVTQEQWDRMTVEERQRNGLPLTQWAETTPTPIINTSTEPTPQFSEIANGGKTLITPISNDSVQQATLAADGQNSIFYNANDGRFYQIDKDGQMNFMSDQAFHNVDKVDWSPNKDKAIIEYPDGFKIMYDFENKKQYSLPNNWQDFSWDSRGDKIAFKATSQYPENSWLAVANADGTESKSIENMGTNADKVIVSWSPSNQVVAFSSTGEVRGTWQQEVLLIGQNGENFKSLVVDGRGFEPQWNPRGDSIAYSVYSADNGYKPTLYLVKAQGDAIGSNKINTGLNTWTDKCSYNLSGSYLYCAVPKDLPQGSGLMRSLADNATDNFYKINAATGEVAFLAEGAMGNYNAESIFVSSNEDILYFVDRSSGKLRYIRLK